jgi:glutamine synthetase
MLQAGLDGIRRGLTPPPPVEEDAYHLSDSRMKELDIVTLPATLGEAISEIERDKVLQEALGEHAYKVFLRAKKAEWEEYRIHVTDWELRRYLGVLLR